MVQLKANGIKIGTILEEFPSRIDPTRREPSFLLFLIVLFLCFNKIAMI